MFNFPWNPVSKPCLSHYTIRSSRPKTMLPLQISFMLYPLCQQVLVKQSLNGFNCLPTLHFCLMSNLVIHPTIKGQALSLLITKIKGEVPSRRPSWSSPHLHPKLYPIQSLRCTVSDHFSRACNVSNCAVCVELIIPQQLPEVDDLIVISPGLWLERQRLIGAHSLCSGYCDVLPRDPFRTERFIVTATGKVVINRQHLAVRILGESCQRRWHLDLLTWR